MITLSIKESGKMAKRMELESYILIMEKNMRENSRMINSMGEVSITKIHSGMKESMRREKRTGESHIMQIMADTKEITKRIKKMGRESGFGTVAIGLKESTRME